MALASALALALALAMTMAMYELFSSIGKCTTGWAIGVAGAVSDGGEVGPVE